MNRISAKDLSSRRAAEVLERTLELFGSRRPISSWLITEFDNIGPCTNQKWSFLSNSHWVFSSSGAEVFEALSAFEYHLENLGLALLPERAHLSSASLVRVPRAGDLTDDAKKGGLDISGTGTLVSVFDFNTVEVYSDKEMLEFLTHNIPEYRLQ